MWVFVPRALMSAMWCIAELGRTRRDFRVVPKTKSLRDSGGKRLV